MSDEILTCCIGERVKKVQESYGYSNDKMAKILIVSTDHYRKMCRTNMFTQKQIKRLGTELNVSADYLIHGEEASSMFIHDTVQEKKDNLPVEIKLFELYGENSDLSLIEKLSGGIDYIEDGLDYLKKLIEELSPK